MNFSQRIKIEEMSTEKLDGLKWNLIYKDFLTEEEHKILNFIKEILERREKFFF